MLIHEYKNINRTLFKTPVVTIGIFDGVHRGHLNIINALKQKALEINGESVVLTLWPHPRMVLTPKKDIKLITTLPEKIARFQLTGIDHLVVVPFNIELSTMSAERFVKEIMVDNIGMTHFVVGFDNHIGHNREGGFEKIKQLSEEFSFKVEQLKGIYVGTEKISSSNIRHAIESGNIEKASEFLGYLYSLSGKVIKGKMIGRQIGFPTANIKTDDYKMIPANGVYVVKVAYKGIEYPGMLNIGNNPTIIEKEMEKTIEVHIIGFNGDLYNQEISISFVRRLRDEIKFNSVDELIAQLYIDKQQTIEILNYSN